MDANDEKTDQNKEEKKDEKDEQVRLASCGGDEPFVFRSTAP